MTKEQIKRNKRFVWELSRNTRKTTEKMRSKNGGRCCLCVAYDVAQNLGAGLPDLDKDSGMPPDDMAKFYGWISKNPHIGEGENRHSAASHNDGDGDGCKPKTHKEIAKLFRKEFLS